MTREMKKLLKLMKENPELPVVHKCLGSELDNDYYHVEIDDIKIGEYIDMEDYFFDDREELKEFLDRNYIWHWDKTEEQIEDELNKLMKKYDKRWKKAIIVELCY